MSKNEVRRVSMAEYTAFILRGLISYHERMHTGPLRSFDKDGKPLCDKVDTCPSANNKNDDFLEAIKFALAAVEEKI